MSTPKRVVFVQCTMRSITSKRARRGGSGGDGNAGSGDGIVTAPIRSPDPRVDGVPAHFPVPALHAIDHFDLAQPFRRLVSVHGCHVHAHGPSVRGRDRL